MLPLSVPFSARLLSLLQRSTFSLMFFFSNPNFILVTHDLSVAERSRGPVHTALPAKGPRKVLIHQTLISYHDQRQFTSPQKGLLDTPVRRTCSSSDSIVRHVSLRKVCRQAQILAAKAMTSSRKTTANNGSAKEKSSPKG